MPMFDFFLILLGIFAGFIGSLSGLGGGIIVIPALTVFLKVPIEYAAGTSLFAAIATSSAAASTYIRDQLTNLKIGMSLEIATTWGAILGSMLAATLYAQHLHNVMFIFFGIVLFISILPILVNLYRKENKAIEIDKTTRIFQLKGSYYDFSLKRRVHYAGSRWWLGELTMFIAGILSGLLGIGSGALKVIGMDWIMRLPIKVSTSTSNLMIGVSAAASVGVYLSQGYIKASLVAPTVIGTLIGSFFGTKLLNRLHHRKIQLFFIFLIFLLSIEMVLRGCILV